MAPNTASLKIGLVLDTSLDTSEGVPQYVLTIGEWLRSQGHNVHYLVGQSSRRDVANVHSLARNIRVRFNGTNTTIPLPANRRKLRSFIKTENFDIIHVQVPHHPLMAQHLILAAEPQTAVIGTFHILPYGRLSRGGTKALGAWLRPSLKRFDRMLAVSEAAAEFCQASFGIKADVLPNVINYPRFHDAKPFPAYTDSKLTVLFLGRLVARKGCGLLLEAVAKLTKDPELPPFRVLVCGKGHLLPKLEQYVNHHGLKDIVTFTGFVSEADKPRYYASADLAVFPSSGGESFGIVLLEAMSSGHAAVLAGDNPGYRSVVAPQPKLLFNPHRADELAEKLAYYLVENKQRQQMADWGSDYTRNFDVAIVGAQLLNIYHQALHKRRQQ